MKYRLIVILSLIVSIVLSGCTTDNSSTEADKHVPHLHKWGIYCLDVTTENISMLYSTDDEISTLRLNSQGDCFVFSQYINGTDYEYTEICTIHTDGTHFQRLTNNTWWDVYPTWSPDGERIAYLSYPEDTLSIFMMRKDGADQKKFYDSGSHDADIHWVGNVLVFTSESCIWKINVDTRNVTQLTHPPNAGVWGVANLPFGDYDPNISPDGAWIAFERLENDENIHGNYNIFIISSNGSEETRLTHTNYSQGLPTWSHDGRQILYIVAAINDKGIYDLYLMNADGTGNRNITPGFVPDDFLCHAGVFSNDDGSIYFIGEWWS